MKLNLKWSLLMMAIFALQSDVSYSQTGCYPASSMLDLDINNVRAKIFSSGDMWWDLVGAARYEVPKGSNVNSMFAGSFWFGGVDQGGQLRVAAMTYRQDGVDFWPGPLDSSQSINRNECYKYDRLWKLDKSTVEEFIALRNTSGYSIPTTILEWPGNGNTSIGQSQYLAPFHDINGDGIYDPVNGDYPEFDFQNTLPCNERLNGDQVLWWVFNDKGNNHTQTMSQGFGLEVHAQAYAFRTNDEINDATLYQFKMINRSSLTIQNAYAGYLVDSDIGEYSNDMVGCDIGRSMGYSYNGQPLDGSGNTFTYGEHPPAIGFDILRGPLADPGDGVDNDLDGTIDEQGETCNLNGLLSYRNDNSPSGNPVGAQDFYNYLKHQWRDGSPITYGGWGYGTGGVSTNYMYQGDSDPTGLTTGGIPQAPWDQPTFSDVRYVASAGPFTLSPGEVTYLNVGLPWARDTSGDNLDAIPKLKAADDKLQLFFDNCFTQICSPLVNDFNYSANGLAVTFSCLNSNATYSWDFGDGTSSADRFNIHNYAQDGTYYVCLNVVNSCDTVNICKLHLRFSFIRFDL